MLMYCLCSKTEKIALHRENFPKKSVRRLFQCLESSMILHNTWKPQQRERRALLLFHNYFVHTADDIVRSKSIAVSFCYVMPRNSIVSKRALPLSWKFHSSMNQSYVALSHSLTHNPLVAFSTWSESGTFHMEHHKVLPLLCLSVYHPSNLLINKDIWSEHLQRKE